MSEYYDTGTPGSPNELPVYKGIHAGDKVEYVGPLVMEGTFVVKELIQFAVTDILCIMADVNKRPDGSDDIYEVNADNLRKVEGQ